MKLISSYIANRDAPSSGFSKGKLKDNPGDDTGSGATVQTINDFLYGFYAFIEKYRTGGISDVDESETQSDVIDALEEMLGLKVDGVNAWASGTTYSTPGTAVMRQGMQFVNVNNTGNLNKDPVTQPGYWMAVPRTADLFRDFASGRVVRGHATPVHDYNNTLYQQFFSLGKHKPGGASGAYFNAWGVHLDGGTITAASWQDNILTGYFLQTTFAPGAPKVLGNAKDTVDRSHGATGGVAPTIGARQEDQGQGHGHNLAIYGFDPGIGGPITNGPTIQSGQAKVAATSSGNGVTNNVTTNQITDGANGTPRTGSETRVKSFVTGVPYFVVMVPA